MKNNNVIDFLLFKSAAEKNTNSTVDEELIIAIKKLIQQLREHTPFESE